MKIITIEEHLAGAPINRYLARYSTEDAPYMAIAHGKGRPYDADPELFGDLDKRRIEDMDKHGITMQILSCPEKSQLLPMEEAPGIVSETQDIDFSDGKRRFGGVFFLKFLQNPLTS